MWKEIKGYEGLYEVSDKGEVRSVDRVIEYINKWGNKSSQLHKGKSMSVYDNGRGYKNVRLYKNNKGKMLYIHRLVAEAFIGSCEGLTVNHIDFDKSNNCVDNLEIVSQSENNNHSSEAGRYKDKGGTVVNVYYKDGRIEQYKSLTSASKGIGCHRDTLSKYMNGYPTAGKKRFAELGILKIAAAQ